MEFKKWETPFKGSQDEKEVVDLLKAFSSTLKKIPLYPATHPMVKDSILQLYLGLDKFSKTYGDFVFDITDNNIMICEKPFEASGMNKELTAEFKKISIEGITFKQGVSDYELESFLKLFLLKPDMIKEKGGLKQIMADQEITKIIFNEVHYARIKTEEEIRKITDESGLGEGDGQGSGQAEANSESEDKDIVGMVSDFFSGKSDEVPDKEVISYEFKRNARRVVKQLLELVGPEKAVDEILALIEARFDKAGFSTEEKDVYVEKVKKQIIKLKTPKLSKKDLEKQLKALKQENKRVHELEQENEKLKKMLKNADQNVDDAVMHATATLTDENKKIKREKHRINSVLKHVAEGLIIIDNEGKVLVLNPAAEQLLGASKESKVGQHILEDIKEDQMVSLAKDGQREIEIELAGPSAGTKKTLRASSAVIENEEGQTVGMVSVLSDITRQKELERMKDTFVSNVTHDLRAPLISIQKSLSLVLDISKDTMSSEQKQFLEIASNNASRLTILVNDLLDVAKLESGRTRLEYAKTNLEEVINTVFDMLGAWANSRGVKLKKEGVSDILFDADAKLLGQLFNNLVGNAIKFTPEGGSVKIFVQRQDKDLRFEVIDTGCGIPEDSLEKIFAKFEQAKTIPASGSPKGTGLGLTIVKEIVLLHGGKIWVESEIGKGSKFIFVLPFEKEVLDIRD
ncbi:MAG: cell wall metabolism sensor histidine kinase WalK [Candidatus Omnitrophica bacterium]|nr:cell wall metabolism sensor histidine kinase WalK [Candidatus Omnitrophota bacterium]